MFNLLEELCITRLATINSFARLLGVGKHIYINIYIFIIYICICVCVCVSEEADVT